MIIIIPSAVTSQESLKTFNLGDINVVKISAIEESAVVKTPTESLRVIKVGDVIGNNGKVTEISTNRIIIEEATKKGLITTFITFENGNRAVKRIIKFRDSASQHYTPVINGNANNNKTFDSGGPRFGGQSKTDRHPE